MIRLTTLSLLALFLFVGTGCTDAVGLQPLPNQSSFYYRGFEGTYERVYDPKDDEHGVEKEQYTVEVSRVPIDPKNKQPRRAYDLYVYARDKQKPVAHVQMSFHTLPGTDDIAICARNHPIEDGIPNEVNQFRSISAGPPRYIYARGHAYGNDDTVEGINIHHIEDGWCEKNAERHGLEYDQHKGLEGNINNIQSLLKAGFQGDGLSDAVVKFKKIKG